MRFARVVRALAAVSALALLPTLAFAQGAMTNGANHAGTIGGPGEVDVWTFSATQGEAIIVRIGEVVRIPDSGFNPWIRVLDTGGNLVFGGSQSNSLVAEVSTTAALTGTYTVEVRSNDAGLDGEGDYVLRLARAPEGQTAGDEGGQLVSGAAHPGVIDIGDLDIWTFTAAQNDTFIVRIGEDLPGAPDPGFNPWIRVFDTQGSLVFGGSQSNTLVTEVSGTASLGGTYTVVVTTGDANYDGTGAYDLRLATARDMTSVPGGDEGGEMVATRNHPGRITVGDLDVWQFDAQANDSFVVRIGEVPVGDGVPDPDFYPWLRVFDSQGALVFGGSQSNALVTEVTGRATLAGRYTVVVTTGDANYDGTGDYLIRLAQTPHPLETPVDDQGGPMTSGQNHSGRIGLGDLDVWTFHAVQNDSFIVRIGEVEVGAGTPNPGFYPWIRVYDTLGALVFAGSQSNELVTEVSGTAALTGTYTVVVTTGDANYDGTGDYLLRLARMPFDSTVPAGDEGGAMANGGNHSGRIALGDLDIWTFQAVQNEEFVVRIGEVEVGAGTPDPGFNPWIRVYDTLGDLIFAGSQANVLVTEVSGTAGLTGRYTVVVTTNDANYDGTGDYLLRVVTAATDLATPPGDHGGPMTNATDHPGRITLGDLDAWTFTACAGEPVALTIAEVPVGSGTPDPGFNPWIRLYSPSGVLVFAGSQANTDSARIDHTPVVGGRFNVVVTTIDANYDGVGDYILRVVGACTPPTVPTTNNDPSYTTPFNTPLVVAAPGLLANDASNGGGALSAVSFSAVTPTGSGVLTPSATGAFTFTPVSTFTGPATFTYRASNTAGLGNTASVTITVGAAPAPTAAADNYTATANTPLVVAAPGVLSNDTSPGGSAMTATLVSPTSNGGINLSGTGGFTYTPNAAFSGTDAFTYRVSNANGQGNVATVTISVQAAPTSVQAPTSLFAHAIIGDMVTLRWSAPATGPAPTSYAVEGGVNPGQVIASIPTGSTVPLFTFKAPSGAFYLRVKAVAAGQTSAASNEIRVFVNQPVAPSAPSNLLGLTNGSAVALSWRPTFGGGAASSYVLDVTGTVNASLPVGLADSFTFNGVPGGSYTFRVRAVNAFGASGASNSVPLAFPGPCTGAPQTPADFLVYRVGNTVHLLWNPAAAGPAQTAFVLNVTGAINLSLPLPTRGISAPVPPGSYTFTVAAANACGTSAATAAQTVTIP